MFLNKCEPGFKILITKVIINECNNPHDPTNCSHFSNNVCQSIHLHILKGEYLKNVYLSVYEV